MCKVSFIVPAFNEASHIADIVGNIRGHVPPTLTFEVLVVDNASTDATYENAQALSEVRAIRASGTVGAARNAGVELAQGEILIFLDADVRLTRDWMQAIQSRLDALEVDQMIVTGSTVAVPDAATIIEKCWFEPLTSKPRKYINSGHLIVSRQLFLRLGGFDVSLRTGEDSDFSERATLAGARIVNDPTLKAIHLGFPQTIGAFSRRELWHGQGDTGSLQQILHSSVASLSLLFTSSILLGLVASVAMGSIVPLVIACIATMAVAAILAARRTRGHGVKPFVVSTLLYYVYFFSRAAAVFFHPARWRQS